KGNLRKNRNRFFPARELVHRQEHLNMTGSQPETDTREAGPFKNPWTALIAAGITIPVALGLNALAPESLGLFRFTVTCVGILAAGAAVAIRPRSPEILGLAAATALVFSFIGPEKEWDSARLVLRVLSGVAGFAAVIMLFPPVVRRVAFSLVILFHF